MFYPHAGVSSQPNGDAFIKKFIIIDNKSEIATKQSGLQLHLFSDAEIFEDCSQNIIAADIAGYLA